MRLETTNYLNFEIEDKKANLKTATNTNKVVVFEKSTENNLISKNNVNANFISSDKPSNLLTFGVPSKSKSNSQAVNEFLTSFKSSNNKEEQKAANLIEKLLEQTKDKSLPDREFLLGKVAYEMKVNSDGKDKIRALEELSEENKVNKTILATLDLDLDVITELDEKETLIDPALVERAKNKTLSVEDRNTIMLAINKKLNSNEVSNDFKSSLKVELDKLKNLDNKIRASEKELIGLKYELKFKSEELRADIKNLSKKAPALANALSKSLDMVENSTTEASMRLKFMFLNKLDSIISSKASTEEKLKMISNMEKEYNSLLKNIQTISSNTNITQEEASKQVSTLLENYVGKGKFSSEELNSFAKVIVSSVRGSTDNKPQVTKDIPTTEKPTNTTKNDEIKPEGENLLETAGISSEVSQTLNILIEEAQSNPESFQEACTYWQENNSFENYSNSLMSVFEKENEINTLKEDFNTVLAQTIKEFEKPNKNMFESNKLLTEEINNTINIAKLLELNLIDDFRQLPESSLSELLNKFRTIITELDLKTRDSSSKSGAKTKIDHDFMKRIKEDKDKEKIFYEKMSQLKKLFEELKK